MEGDTTPDSDREPAQSAGKRNEARADSGQARVVRYDHFGQREYRLQLLPYALRRLERTDLVAECDDGGVSRLRPLPVRQTEAAELHLFTVLPCPRFQRDTAGLLWGQLLGS